MFKFFKSTWVAVATPNPALGHFANMISVAQAIVLVLGFLWAALEGAFRLVGLLLAKPLSFTGLVAQTVVPTASLPAPAPINSTARQVADPLDPKTGNFGVPAVGDGSTLASYAMRSNAKSVLHDTPDISALSDFIAKHGDPPYFGDFCRIDPYAGVLVRRILPNAIGVEVIAQGSDQSMLGRSQSYEPALANIDFNAAKRSIFTSIDQSGNITSLKNSAGDTLTLKLSKDRMSATIKGLGDDQSEWNNCGCVFEGSFITCDKMLMKVASQN